MHGRDIIRGAETVKAIEDRGGRARFVAADLAESGAAAELAAAAGPVDVLVNNAGFAWFGPSDQLDEATFDKMFAANVRSAYQLVAALAPGMAERGHGSIVSVDSMAGHVGLSGAAAYGATKAALTAMSRSWAAEYSPAGVRVNTVAPGPVYTNAADEELIQQTGRHHVAQPGGPAGRNRRGHRIPGVRQGELHHRRGHSRRRRPHRNLSFAILERTEHDRHLYPQPQ